MVDGRPTSREYGRPLFAWVAHRRRRGVTISDRVAAWIRSFSEQCPRSCAARTDLNDVTTTSRLCGQTTDHPRRKADCDDSAEE